MKNFLATVARISFACFIIYSAHNLVAAPPVVTEPWHVTARDAHSHVWESLYLVTDEITGKTREEKHRYVETATGLNYLSPATRQYEPSEEKFAITAQGDALAAKGQHQLRLSANINAGASVSLTMPDGQTLLSNPMGLSFFDSASGKNVLIAEVKDCVGQLVAPNVVVYPDAFTDIKGAIRYTYTKAGFEQDIILYQNMGSPADWGLDPATTRLVMYSEFHNPPAPEKTVRLTADNVNDETLDFPAMRIASGAAYFFNQEMDSIRAVAQWVNLEQRDFLAEILPYPKVQPLLEKLQASVKQPQKQGEWAQQVFATRRELLAKLESRRDHKTALAAIQPARTSTEPAVVLDYTTINTTQTNWLFAGDVTFYISDQVALYGTNNVIEGGCVLKYPSSPTAYLKVNGQLHFQTGPWRPAIFTGKDDNTVGEVISGSTGAPSLAGYAKPALELTGTPAPISHVRIAYAQVGMVFSGSPWSLSHAQFLNCGVALRGDGSTLNVHNTLVSSANKFCEIEATTLAGQHLTVHRCDTLVYPTDGGESVVKLTNSLLVAVTNLGSNFSFYTNYTPRLSSDSGVFQTVGYGAHYLATGSPYRDAGTSNIDPVLASELKSRTTYPPTVLSSIPYDMTLTPQAGRDTDTPDLGWHYTPLDWLASGVSVSSNVTVTASGGVALGIDYSSSSWGFILNNAKFISAGDALQNNYIVRAHTVQEFSGGNPGTRACFYDGDSSGGSRDCEVRLRFTEFDQLSNDGWMTFTGTKCGALEWTHCRLFGAVPVVDTSGSGTLVCGLTNSVWERGGLQFGVWSTTGSGVTVHLRNNLFRNLSFLHLVLGTTNWTVRDNLFDHPSYLGDHGSPVANSHNGYDTNTTPLSSSAGNDVTITNFDYRIGPLGSYYYPTNGGHLSRLLNAGSQSATNVGLYHFTTRFDQIKEADSIVDVGYHYVALRAENIAFEQPATQSSTYGGCGPARAVDGNVDGDLWNGGSVTVTEYDAQAWWQVDLGQLQDISTIRIWNRTDAAPERLSNFYVLVSSEAFQSTNLSATLNQSGVSSYYMAGTAGSPTIFSINRSGRYVRVQLAGTNYLSLAEVEVLTLVNGGESANLRDGLVGQWLLDEGNGTTIADSSGYAHHGSLLNGPTWVNGHLGGKAVNFDGSDDYATNIESSALRLTGDMTLAFWMKKNSEPSNWCRLVGKGDNLNRNYGIWADYQLGLLMFQQYKPDTGWYVNLYSASGTSTGAWYHVAAVVKGTNVYFYLNGLFSSSTTRSGSPPTSADPVTFAYSGYLNHFDGALDDIRIYNRALSSPEMAALANTVTTDKDGDGIPDYLEDANGNGTVDWGETDWNSATDTGLKVLITRPKNNSIIP